MDSEPKLTEVKKGNVFGSFLRTTDMLKDIVPSKDTLKLTQKKRPQNENAGLEPRLSDKSIISHYGLSWKPGIHVDSIDSESSSLVASSSTTSSKSFESIFFGEYGEEVYERESEKISVKESLYSSDELSEEVVFDHLVSFISNMPDISDISSALSVIDEIRASLGLQVIGLDPKADIGKFVNPLTGMSSSSSTPPTETIEVSEKLRTDELLIYNEEGEEEGEEEENEFGIFEIPEDDDLLNMILEFCEQDDEEPKPLKTEDDEFGELQTKFVAFTQEVVEDEQDELLRKEKEEKKRQLNNFMDMIIDDLISYAIFAADAMDTKLLREKLDKRKIVNDIAKVIDKLYMENRVASFLNRKCVEYYKRKQMFKCLEDIQTVQDKEQRARYKHCLQFFDQKLGEEKSKTEIYYNTIQDLKQMVIEHELAANMASNHLEALIMKSILTRRASPELEVLVNQMFQDMSVKRDEISKVRTKLFLISYTYADLMKELYKMESLGGRGPGSTVIEYERLQTEVSILQTKLEERNHEMELCRARFETFVHTIAHIKATEQMLLDLLWSAQQKLRELKRAKLEARDHIMRLKWHRDEIRYNLRKTSHGAGLQDKAALMKDYDDAMVHIERLKGIMEPLRAKYAKLEDMIEELSGLNKWSGNKKI